jgi:hypothetical protein
LEINVVDDAVIVKTYGPYSLVKKGDLYYITQPEVVQIMGIGIQIHSIDQLLVEYYKILEHEKKMKKNA